MAEPELKWAVDAVGTDAVSKGDLVAFLQEHGSPEFLKSHKLNGKLANVIKSSKKDQLAAAYRQLFETKAFRDPNAPDPAAPEISAALNKVTVAEPAAPAAVKPTEAPVPAEKPKFTKSVEKKGDKTTFPKKGDTVGCWYTGYLTADGKIFDSNTTGKNKQKKPLSFKVGQGKVIRGWDEGLLTMSKGEKAKLVIEADWAYGKKGLPEAGIPPNASLTFEVELVSID